MARIRNLRTELIRSKLADIEESVDLVAENLPQSFEEFSKLGLSRMNLQKNGVRHRKYHRYLLNN